MFKHVLFNLNIPNPLKWLILRFENLLKEGKRAHWKNSKKKFEPKMNPFNLCSQRERARETNNNNKFCVKSENFSKIYPEGSYSPIGLAVVPLVMSCLWLHYCVKKVVDIWAGACTKSLSILIKCIVMIFKNA